MLGSRTPLRPAAQMEVCAYVIMSSHVHMIIGRNSDPSLEGIIRDIKKYTAATIINSIKRNTQEIRRELLMFLYESAGKRYSHNTKYPDRIGAAAQPSCS